MRIRKHALLIEDKYDAIIVGDPHIYGKNPLCRKDDLVSIQFDKLEELAMVSNTLKLPVICVGDITNSPYISYGFFTPLSLILQRFEYGFYFVYGQHDLWYHDMDSSDSTALGALENSVPNLRRISQFKDDYGIGFDYANWGREITKTGSDILLTHMPIVPKIWVEKFDWLRASQGERKYLFFEDLYPIYKLMICGDWHRRYMYSIVRDRQQCLLINPGAMTRREASNDSMETLPSYTLINFKRLIHKVIPFKAAKPFDEVISTAHLNITHFKKELSKELIAYMQTIKLNDRDRSKYMQYLIECISTKKAPTEVIKIVKELILEVFGKKIAYETAPQKYRLQVKES